MFCKNCGKEIDDKAYVCPNCGVKVEHANDASVTDADSGARAGWGILSFLIPLVGLILFLMWKNERPKTAKICGICALVSFIASIVIGIIYGVIAAIIISETLGSLSVI